VYLSHRRGVSFSLPATNKELGSLDGRNTSAHNTNQSASKGIVIIILSRARRVSSQPRPRSSRRRAPRPRRLR
jgi:hypothetical protein